MVLAAGTPLPYSIMLYFQGLSRINPPLKVALAVFIGRIIKYGLFVGLYLGGSGLISLLF